MKKLQKRKKKKRNINKGKKGKRKKKMGCIEVSMKIINKKEEWNGGVL
ncbi:hypothetical protein [Pasteurella multocida]|nr:hypothetical protein [Pasteurella multocida]NMR53414.1 hypothetical protein [Pasteurella multocida]NMR63354.1 hypothetical protein [Pasteurella multocida]